MLFFEADVNESTTNKFNPFGGTTGQFKKMQEAFEGYVAVVTTDMDKLAKIVQNTQKNLVGADTAARNLIRSMGGVADFTGKGRDRLNEFRKTLSTALEQSIEFGGTMKDVQDSVAGLSEGMGRMVNPSANLLTNVIATSKAFGLTTKETTKMVTDLVKIGGTQEEALVTMRGLADEARRAGINTAAYMKAVQGGLKMASGFGFKNGIEGLKNMAKQAAMLRTNIESIGAKGLQNKVLDPEGAIAAAAGFQMLGGAVGKLGDPFQLLYMAQSDMEGLQNELAKSTSSAFKFNKATGTFKASTEDLYRLRQQAELTGANFDDMVESGREMAKLDYISQSIPDLESLDEAQQGLISSLAQIDKNGKVTVDIPGFDEIDKNTGEVKDLATLMKDQNFKDALNKYQIDSQKDAKQIALDQMNIEDKQLVALQKIQQAVFLSLDASEQKKILEDIEKSNKDMSDAYQTVTTGVDDKIGKLVENVTETEAAGASAVGVGAQQIKDVLRQIGINDAVIPSGGSAPAILSKGKLYKGIVGDDVAVGVGLGDALSKVNSGALTGAIDININLNGTVNGDSGQITRLFNSPEIQKQIMDTVIYKIKDYKRQQGVLS